MSREGLRAILLGAPGSGKGTQAERLAAALRVPAVSTGEMLRQAVLEGNELGARVESVMAAGALVDDALMADVVRARLGRQDARHGFLLDGYPRTPGQAGDLDRMLEEQAAGLDAVVLLEVPEEVLVRRSLARKRADDREEVVRERQRVYREATEPLIGLYEGRGLLRRVDGNRSVDEVSRSILKFLERG